MFYLKSGLRWCIVKCSAFLHEYNLKHYQILTDVLKVNKENPFEEIRQKYYNEPTLQISEWQKIGKAFQDLCRNIDNFKSSQTFMHQFSSFLFY